MDTSSTGSTISKYNLDAVTKSIDIEECISKKEKVEKNIEPEEPKEEPKEEKIEELTIDNFLDDFKL